MQWDRQYPITIDSFHNFRDPIKRQAMRFELREKYENKGKFAMFLIKSAKSVIASCFVAKKQMLSIHFVFLARKVLQNMLFNISFYLKIGKPCRQIIRRFGNRSFGNSSS